MIQEMPCHSRARCYTCKGRLKIWPRKLGLPYTCDNFSCEKPRLGASVVRYNCFVCDFDLCEVCVGSQLKREKNDKVLGLTSELYQNENTDQRIPPDKRNPFNPEEGLNKNPVIVISGEMQHYNEYQNPFDPVDNVQDGQYPHPSQGYHISTFGPDIRRSYECLNLTESQGCMGRARSQVDIRLSTSRINNA